MNRTERQKRIRRRRIRRRLFLCCLALALCAGLALTLLPRGSVIAQDDIELPDWITVDLLPVNPWSRPGSRLRAVNGVVVHYVGNPGTTAAQNHSYFESLAETQATKASSNFLIGLDGEILLNVPMDEVAFCSNSRNNDTLSIECCHPDETGAFTQETYDSLVRLLRWLCGLYELSPKDDVIRHYDVTGKQCPLYYVKNPNAWDALLRQLQ